MYFMSIRPGGARQAKLDPKWQDGAFIVIRDRSDEMLIDDHKWSEQNDECPESTRWDFEFLMTLKGTPWNPNPAAGKMAADVLPADMEVPMPAPAPVDRAASRVYIKKADVQNYGYSMNCPGCRSVMTNTTARANTEECRKILESCLAEDKETESGLVSGVESSEKPRTRDAATRAEWSGEQLGRGGSGKWFSADGVSSSSANERLRSHEVPDYGVKEDKMIAS